MNFFFIFLQLFLLETCISVKLNCDENGCVKDGKLNRKAALNSIHYRNAIRRQNRRRLAGVKNFSTTDLRLPVVDGNASLKNFTRKERAEEEESSTKKNRDDFPAGTHCDKSKRDGSMCCNFKLAATMQKAVSELATSPMFGPKAAGVVAELIKKRVQQRLEQVFEVIVSTGDFAYASYSLGDNICKFEDRGFHILAYETPNQGSYDPFYTELEDYFSEITKFEPLGTTNTTLPGQKSLVSRVPLVETGHREGFPIDSYCEEEGSNETPRGRGLESQCCNLPVFRSMNEAYNNLRMRKDFNPYDKRRIAKVLRDAAENAVDHSMETFVSTANFVWRSMNNTRDQCKYKVDDFYVLVYKSPVAYPLHTDFYADNGEAEPLSCPEDVNYIHGGHACCNGQLKYHMGRRIHEHREGRYEKYDTDRIARSIARSVQGDFNTRFETIVSRSDFSWRTNSYNMSRACKVVTGGYHILSFQSSQLPPLPGEFAEVLAPFQAPPPPLPAQAPVPFFGQPPPVPQFVPPQFAPPQFAPPQFGPPQLGPPQLGPPQFGPPQLGPPQLSPPQLGPPQFPPPQFQPAQIGPPQPPTFFQAAPAFSAPAASGAAAGGGGGGGACFSIDTWVTTPKGKVRMDNLKVGDYVLTANMTDYFFAPVTLWMHREPEEYGMFITIMTEYGKALRLTPKHLIFRNKCDEDYAEFVHILPANSEAVFAEELEKGDCMILLYKDGFRQQRLAEIYPTRKKGIYAPLTSNGRILVNGYLASCYSDVKAITLQTTYFSAISNFRENVRLLLGSFGTAVVELPFFTSFTKELLQLAVPN